MAVPLCSTLFFSLTLIGFTNAQLIFPWLYPVQYAYWALGGAGIGAAIPNPGIGGTNDDVVSLFIPGSVTTLASVATTASAAAAITAGAPSVTAGTATKPTPVNGAGQQGFNASAGSTQTGSTIGTGGNGGSTAGAAGATAGGLGSGALTGTGSAPSGSTSGAGVGASGATSGGTSGAGSGTGGAAGGVGKRESVAVMEGGKADSFPGLVMSSSDKKKLLNFSLSQFAKQLDNVNPSASLRSKGTK